MAKETFTGILERASDQDGMVVMTFRPWQRGDEVDHHKSLVMRVRLSKPKAAAAAAAMVAGKAYRTAGEVAEQVSDMVWVDPKKLPAPVDTPPALAASAKALAKPVVVKDAALGKLTLDRQLRYFTGRAVLWGARVAVSLETEDPAAIPGLAKHFAANASAKAKATHYKAIADKVLKLANDWSDKPLTAKQLLATLVPESINLSPSGGAVIYWKCGRVFHGHGIMTEITRAGRVKRAEMC